MFTSNSPETDRVAIVGGGLAGSLLALALARRGFGVDVYERRSDPRVDGAEGGRSINLGLSKRGIQALTEVGLIDEVMPMTVTMCSTGKLGPLVGGQGDPRTQIACGHGHGATAQRACPPSFARSAHSLRG